MPELGPKYNYFKDELPKIDFKFKTQKEIPSPAQLPSFAPTGLEDLNTEPNGNSPGLSPEEIRKILDEFLPLAGGVSPLNLDTFPDRGKKRKPTLREAKKLVNDNGGIADFGEMTLSFIVNMAQIADKHGISLNDFMASLAMHRAERFSGRVIDRARRSAGGSALRYAVEQYYMDISSADSANEAHTELNGFPFAYSRLLNTPKNANARVLEMLLFDQHTKPELMRIIDDLADESSRDNFAEMDKSAEDGQVLQKDVVIVGGGPLTAVAASVLSLTRNVTVISDNSRLGDPMRSRPFNLNSTIDEVNPLGRQLPFATGSTTPIRARGLLNAIGPDAVIDEEDTLKVTCDDGTVREYVAARRLGEAAAVQIINNTDDIILRQIVVPEGIEENGDTCLALIDAEGQERKIHAKSVIFLGGPGNEQPLYSDVITNKLSNGSYDEIEDQINALEEMWVQGRAGEFNFRLPRILNLTVISRMLSAWEQYMDRDPSKYPLKELFDNNTISVVGAGDTGRTMVEFLTGTAPSYAYPEDFQMTSSGLLWFGQQNSTPPEFQQNSRRRYEGAWPDDKPIRPINSKVQTVRLNFDGLVLTGSDGENYECDYLINATGFSPSAKKMHGDTSDVFDSAGNRIAKKGQSGEYLAGSYAGISKGELPDGIQKIIDGLGIPENTIAMWVNAILVQRLVWLIAAEEKPSEEIIREILSLQTAI